MGLEPSVQKELSSIGQGTDDTVPLFEAALLMSSLYHKGLDLDRFRQHLKKLVADISLRFHDLRQAGAEDTAQSRVAALKHVIADQYGYRGVSERYDDLANADMIEVVERRRGLPIALSILAIEAGRAQGWQVDGLNFPGHFLTRLEFRGLRLIFDPFNDFKILEAPDLRALLKQVAGEQAELSASFYEAASNREILMRLQNNIKLRQVESEDYHGALETVEAMRLVAPQEVRLLFDAGVLYARTAQRQKAIEALDGYIKGTPSRADRYEAQLLLQNLIDSPG